MVNCKVQPGGSNCNLNTPDFLAAGPVSKLQGSFFFCSTLLRCDLLAKKVPGRAPYSQHIIIRNWT